MKWILVFSMIFNLIQGTTAQAQMNLEGSWADTSLVASTAHNNTYSEVWGIVNNGNEYAVIGSTYGTHFIDLNQLDSLKEVLRVEGGANGTQIIHRDYHDFKGYLYAVADEGGTSTLQIMDYSFLPDSVHIVYDSKTYLRRAHNIFIDTATSIMYACISAGDQAPWSPLRLFDLTDPTIPEVIAAYNEFDGFLVSQVHDMYIRDNIAFLNCGPSGFVIADFSDPLAPVTLATLDPSEYPQSGYNHSGWLSADGNTYYMADENWSHDIKVLDVSQLPEITVIDTIDAGVESEFSMPHNQIIHNGLLYSSYYYDGLQVYNIIDPNNIERIAEYSTSKIEHRRRYEGAWGIYPFLPSGLILVSDMQEGLFVLQTPTDLVSTVNVDAFKDIKILPNPVQSQFQIEGLENYDDLKIHLLDQIGNIVAHLDASGRYNLNLPNGVYYLWLTNEQVSSVKTLIIAR